MQKTGAEKANGLKNFCNTRIKAYTGKYVSVVLEAMTLLSGLRPEEVVPAGQSQGQKHKR